MTPLATCLTRLQLVFVAKSRNRSPGQTRSGAFQLHYDGQLAGAVSLVETDAHDAVIGYRVEPEFQCRGLASAAVAAVMASAAGMGFSLLTAQCRSNNPASVRVLEKTGFTLCSSAPFSINHRDGAPLLMVFQWPAVSSQPAVLQQKVRP